MRKVLIIAPAWVGDNVMSQSLYQTIVKYYPKVLIYVLLNKHLVPLLQRMPEVYETIAVDFKHGELSLYKRYLLAQTLRQYQFDQAIVIPNSFKSALIPFWAKIPVRTGFNRELRCILLNDARVFLKKTTTFVKQLISLGLPQHQPLRADDCTYPSLLSTKSHQDLVRAQLTIDGDCAPILALCPGAEFGSTKRWPAKYYAEVARYKIAHGWQVWLLGSAKDQALTAEIMRLTQQRCRDFAGKTQLDQAIDLIAQTNVVISNDSGLLHIAAALNKPLLAIYGATSPQFAPPLNHKHLIHYLDLACQPCGQRQCPRLHLNCLQQLSPLMVIASLDKITNNENITN